MAKSVVTGENYETATGQLFKQSFPIPALPRLSEGEIKRRWNFLKSVTDNSPTEESTFSLDTVLKGDEEWITGGEFEKRLGSIPLKLGLSQAVWIVDHQDSLPRWFMDLLGKVYIVFPETIAVSAYGYRDVPCLGQDGARWCIGWDWLDLDFGSAGRFARSRK